MGTEQPLPEELGFESPYAADWEVFADSPNFIGRAVKRLAKNRALLRERKENLRSDPRYSLGPAGAALLSPDLTGAESDFHPSRTDCGDRFYYGPSQNQPTPLGLAAENPAASAMAYVQELEQQELDD